MLLAISYLAGKLHPTKNIDVRKQLISFFLLLISSALVAIFTEELVFRGCIQRQLLKLTSPLSAILIATTIFGIWHLTAGRWLKLSNAQILVYCIGAGLVGVILGLFYYVSQSLIVAGVLHGLWNGIVYRVWGLGDVAHGLFVSKNDALTHPEYGIMGVSILALAVLLLLIGYL